MYNFNVITVQLLACGTERVNYQFMMLQFKKKYCAPLNYQVIIWIKKPHSNSSIRIMISLLHIYGSIFKISVPHPVFRRRQKIAVKTQERMGCSSDFPLAQKLTLYSLPQDVILMIVDMLDVESCLSLLRTSRWLNDMLSPCDSFWKMLCIKTEFANYTCLETQVSFH